MGGGPAKAPGEGEGYPKPLAEARPAVESIEIYPGYRPTCPQCGGGSKP